MIWGGVEIVRAGAAALEILETLHGACFATGWEAVAIARLLALPGATGTLALVTPNDADPVPAGFLLGSEAGGEAEILSTGVVPEFRTRGIGGALVADFAARMRARGATALFLEVSVNNAAAISLYKRQGFVNVGLRKAYYAPEPGAGGADALVMRCNL